MILKDNRRWKDLDFHTRLQICLYLRVEDESVAHERYDNLTPPEFDDMNTFFARNQINTYFTQRYAKVIFKIEDVYIKLYKGEISANRSKELIGIIIDDFIRLN